jgi:hypothetical protein
MTNAPQGGEQTEPHPPDQGTSGITRSLLTEGHRVPSGVAVEGAHRQDGTVVRTRPKPLSPLQEKGLCAFLEAMSSRNYQPMRAENTGEWSLWT